MFRKPTWPESLRSLDLFARSTPAELQRVGSLLTMLTVPVGTEIISEGSIGLEFMVIADGTARVTVRHGTHDQVVADLGPGDFAGEMSLLARSRRTATVTALTPLTIYVCNSAEFSSLLEAAPSVADQIMRAAVTRSAELAEAA
jgi:CRP-like cAMP-binding protein